MFGGVGVVFISPEKIYEMPQSKPEIFEKRRFSVGHFSGMTGLDNGLTRV